MCKIQEETWKRQSLVKLIKSGGTGVSGCLLAQSFRLDKLSLLAHLFFRTGAKLLLSYHSSALVSGSIDLHCCFQEKDLLSLPAL